MRIIEIIGLIGSSIVAISFIPQTYKIMKDNDVQSISTSFVVVNMISSALMIIYGMHFMIIPMLIANISVFLNNLIIFYYISFS
jgi:uncharacterized protein with PQ loop repeat